MVTEFLIAGLGLYAYRQGEKVVKIVKNKRLMRKYKDLVEINEAWVKMLHNAGIVNKQGHTFSVNQAKAVKYGYELILNIPSGKSFEDLNTIKPTIEAGFGAIVLLSLTKDKKHIKVEIFDKVPDRIKYEPVKAAPYEIFLGYEYSGKPVFMDMSKYFNLLIGGVVGCGKSRLLYIILTNLIATTTPEEVELYSFQTKKSDLYLFKDSDHMKMFATTLEETEAMLYKITKIIDNRGKRMAKGLYFNINEYNEDNEKKMSFIYVVGEESSFLMAEEGDTEEEAKLKGRIKRHLREITRTGRYAGVNNLMVTQRATAEMFDPSQKTNYCRVTGRQMSSTNSTNFIESPEAVGLSNYEFILFENDYRRFRTPLIEKDTVKQYVKSKEVAAAAPKEKESHKPITVETELNTSYELADLDPTILKSILQRRNKFKGINTLPHDEKSFVEPARELEQELKEEEKEKKAQKRTYNTRRRKNAVEVAAAKEE